MTARQVIKALLRGKMWPVFQGMTEKQFELRCCEILDGSVNPASPAGIELARMEQAFTFSRMLREVRRELEAE